MKKTLALLLSVVMILSLTVSAFATDTSSENINNRIGTPIDFATENFTPGNYLYEQQYVDYLISNGLEKDRYFFNSAWYNYREVYTYFAPDNIGDTPDYVLSYAPIPMASCAFCSGIFGEYVMMSNNIYYPSAFGYMVYVPSDNEFYTLEKAWSNNVPDLDKAFENYLLPCTINYDKSTYKGARRIGDADGDGIITIVDATTIQMNLAGLLEYNSYDDIRMYESVTDDDLSYITDFDRDGERSILDATKIQRKLAKLDVAVNEDKNNNISENTNIDYNIELSAVSLGENAYNIQNFYDSCYPKAPDDKSSFAKYEAVFTTYDEYAAYFNTTIDKFDADFFNEKSLIYLCREFCASNYGYNLKELNVDGDTLKVALNYTMESNDGFTVMIDDALFVSVDKNDVKDISNIELIETYDYERFTNSTM